VEIKVLSRIQAENLIPDKKCAIISITDHESDIVKFKYNNNIKGVLRLHFLDEDDLSYYKHRKDDTYRLFSDNDAIKILDFVEEIKDKIDILYIHCYAGLSRSPAVAAALCDIYNIDSEINWFFNYSPNIFVYRTLLNTYNFRNRVGDKNDNNI
jgi:predicted protein tyrosine phosphatase